MSAFVLKLIAIISMTFDHLGYAIFHKVSFFNYIGRLAFPIFAFQISEGYLHTKNLKKYYFRLLSFALISQVPFYLFRLVCMNTNKLAFNIFFTLLFGLACINIIDKCRNRFLSYILIIILSSIAEILNFDYGAFGVLLILSFYTFRNNKILLTIAYILLTTINYINMRTLFLPLFISCLFSLMFIFLYNKKQGKKLKYIFYILYPVHLIILSALSIYLHLI